MFWGQLYLSGDSPNLGANLLLVTSAKSSSPSCLYLQNCEMGVLISR